MNAKWLAFFFAEGASILAQAAFKTPESETCVTSRLHRCMTENSTAKYGTEGCWCPTEVSWKQGNASHTYAREHETDRSRVRCYGGSSYLCAGGYLQRVLTGLGSEEGTQRHHCPIIAKIRRMRACSAIEAATRDGSWVCISGKK